MRLGLRLLFGFFLIAGIATFFIFRVILAEVRPSVREVMEDVLVDSANLLAEQAAPDLRAMAEGGTLEGTRFAASMERYALRPVDAQIWGLHKRSLDFRVYVTDRSGRVVFDTGVPTALGADYSRWRDVALTLRGEYGARATREIKTDERSWTMYVAAPVTDGADILGVLTLAKPQATVLQFVERAERKITVAAAWLLILSLVIGVAVTLWTVQSVRQLRHYAQQARTGEHRPVPKLPGELGELAEAMGAMRDRLDDRQKVEEAMRALTHELKSPLTAIGGAAELLQDDLPQADRQRFSQQIGEQVQRLRSLVDRLLELSKLESLEAPEHPVSLSFGHLIELQIEALSAALLQCGLRVHWLANGNPLVRGNAEQLSLAVSNLLLNAIAFAPANTVLEVAVKATGGVAEFSLRDHGPGVADYAWAQLGRRFFSLPSPRDGKKGSGLGLAIVRQVALLHGGSIAFEDAHPGLRVRLQLPLKLA